MTTQSESPVAAFEGHLSYDVKPRFWASLDGNFWYGGQTKLNGVESPNTLQKNSRVGGTVSVPVNRHQSLKFSYANGAYIRYGGNYQRASPWHGSTPGWDTTQIAMPFRHCTSVLLARFKIFGRVGHRRSSRTIVPREHRTPRRRYLAWEFLF